ncbi:MULTISPECIES: protein kinase [Halorussus]|uniref:protein kinase domain-containing protein n=1 Tax=Halorussus TaxID=1070314 RepID=UPI000E20E1E2|nr:MULTISPECIES: protein kinase [Halorussus]NHN61287.1 protein kinase [Halorussus sp. JP-T4]
MDGRERDDAADDRERGRAGADRERFDRLREAARDRWASADGDVDAAAPRLDSADADERAAAAWTLAELAASDPDRARRLPVEDGLAPLLADGDRWVRRGASWALAAVAEDHPARARAGLSAVAGGLTDDDPLVRENSVLAFADVAREYPRAAEPGLSDLAALASDGDDRVRRTAVETLRRLLVRLDEDGFPRTVAVTPEVAESLRGEADVVEVTEEDDDPDGPAVRVRDASADEERGDDEGDGDTEGPGDRDEESLGPPERIPEVPAVEGRRRDFDRLSDLGGGPLTTAAKARVRTVGEGGHHVVVVLRSLRAGAGVDPDEFAAAIRAWDSLDDHDHVAPVLARGETPRPWLATEFMDGGSLRDAVGSAGIGRAVWYAHCVVTAVCHAHARGVVHGALRPGAVGLSRTLGAWPVPKVGDWAFGGPLSAVRDLPVPPAYAAPEHVAPDEFGRPDPATDVYQVGALCYALLAGRPPFVGDPDDVARRVTTEDPAPPSAHAPAVPETLDALVDRALAREKRARFETAEDLRRELEVVARDLSLSVEL